MDLTDEINETKTEIQELERHVATLKAEEPNNLGRKLVLRHELTNAESPLDETRNHLECLEAQQRAEAGRRRQEAARVRMEEVQREAAEIDATIRKEAETVDKVLSKSAEKVISHHEQLAELANEYWRLQRELGISQPKSLCDMGLLLPITRNKHDNPPPTWTTTVQAVYQAALDLQGKPRPGIGSPFAGQYSAPSSVSEKELNFRPREKAVVETLEEW
jgi:hypothetical protein